MSNSTLSKKTQTKTRPKKADDADRKRTRAKDKQTPITPQTPPSPDTSIWRTPPQSPIRDDVGIGIGTKVEKTPPQSPKRSDEEEEAEENQSRNEDLVAVVQPFKKRVAPPPAINTQLGNSVSPVNSPEDGDHVNIPRTPVDNPVEPFPSADSAPIPNDPWTSWSYRPTDAESGKSPFPFTFGDGPFEQIENTKTEQTKKRKNSNSPSSKTRKNHSNTSPLTPGKKSGKKKPQQSADKKIRNSKPNSAKKRSIGSEDKKDVHVSPRGEPKYPKDVKPRKQKSKSTTRPRAESNKVDDNNNGDISGNTGENSKEYPKKEKAKVNKPKLEPDHVEKYTQNHSNHNGSNNNNEDENDDDDYEDEDEEEEEEDEEEEEEESESDEDLSKQQQNGKHSHEKKPENIIPTDNNRNNNVKPGTPGSPLNGVGRSGAIVPKLLEEEGFIDEPPPFAWIQGERLGVGAYGSVYKGLTLAGIFIAVKKLDMPPHIDSRTRAQINSFTKEIDLYKKLKHPNIVQYLGCQTTKNAIFIFLELLSGGSISSMIKSFGTFPETVIRTYTIQLLDGLEYLHSNGIIHRDIKGANILVDHNGCPKLADFGCSKVTTNLSLENKSVLGTPFWMAPEVLCSTGHGISCDIWSFGCTLVEMDTGRPPYSDKYTELGPLMFALASKQLPIIPENLSQEAQEFIRMCLTWDPHLRPTVAKLKQTRWLTNDKKPPKISIRESLSEQLQLVKNIAYQSVNFGMLTEELALNIFRHLDVESLCRAAEVCAHWWTLSHHRSLWLPNCIKDWPKLTHNPNFSSKVDLEANINWKDVYRERLEADKKRQDSIFHPLDTLIGHFKGNKCVTIFPKSRKIISANDTIKVWKITDENFSGSKSNARVKPRCRSVKEVPRNIVAISGNVDETFLAALDLQNVISLWDLKNKKIVGVMNPCRNSDTSVSKTLQVIGNSRISSSLGNSIQIWDVTEKNILCTLNGHTGSITSLKCVNQDYLLVSASSDNSVKLWDTRAPGNCQITWLGHSSEVTCLSFTGGTILSGSRDGSVIEWDMRSHSSMNYFNYCCDNNNHNHGQVLSLFFDGFNTVFASGDVSNNNNGNTSSNIVSWDYNQGKRLGIFSGDTITHSPIVFISGVKNEFLVTVEEKDKLIKLWHAT